MVIGGGIVGASLAYNLRQVGAQVTLLEQRSVGSAASGLSAVTWNAGQAKSGKRDVFAELCAQTLSVLAEVDSKGFETSFVKSGCLSLACTKGEGEYMKSDFMELQRSGYNVQYLDAPSIIAVEPALKGSCAISAIYTPLSGYVDPLTATLALADAARDARFQCRHVIIAGGISVHELMRPLEKDVHHSEDMVEEIVIPVYPVKGTMFETHAALPHVRDDNNRDDLSKIIYITESHLAWHNGNEPIKGVLHCTHDRAGARQVIYIS